MRITEHVVGEMGAEINLFVIVLTLLVYLRTLTEKGEAYQEQRQREHEKDEDDLIKKFHEAYDAWKTQATDVESFVPKQLPSTQVQKAEREEAILHLQDLRRKTETIYGKIRNDQAPGQEIRQKNGCM